MLDPTKPPLTLAELLQRSFADQVGRPCLGTKDKASGEYQYLTYGEIAQRTRHVAGGFLQLDIERGERIAILSDNRVEWALADFACQMTGIISVPVYPTLPAPQVETILKDCGACGVVVSDAKQLEKIEAIRGSLPQLKHVWNIADGEFDKLQASGEEHLSKNSSLYEMTWPAGMADDVATIIYTSGTTGEPKGVMLTHRNIISNVEAVCRIAPHLGPQELFLSFLPLAHVYERTAGQYFPMRLGAAIAYCESLFTVDKNLGEVKPTVMTCVPRLYESTREKLYAKAKHVPEDKREKYLDALALAIKAGLAHGHAPGAPSLSIMERLKYKVYDAKVYSQIREGFGGRLKHFVSGGAPMAPELGALFLGIGLEILEGYGLTETSPVICVNRPGQPRLATVGPPLPGVEVRIAEDGEICVRADSVMKGYWNKPEESKAVLENGWFHTGDIGHLDEGLLRITDRKKDLLVLANGKKVAPAPIELRLQESRYIGQAVLLGDHLKAVTALIVPRLPALRDWAAKENLGVTGDAEIIKHPSTSKLIRQEIDQQTGDLADFEKVRKFVLLENEFSTQAGELTPTLKVKRKVVAEKYGHLIEA